MPDPQRRPDPSSRPDPYELAIARAAGEPGPDGGSGPPPPRLQVGGLRVGPWGLLLAVGALLTVAGLVRFDGGDRTAQLATSCTRPGLALSVARAQPGGLVHWAATGPAQGPLVVAVDAARVEDGRPVPLPGRPAAQLVPPPFRLDGCRASGRFGIQVPPGEHVVGVFPADRPGPALATAPVTVTELGDPGAGR